MRRHTREGVSRLRASPYNTARSAHAWLLDGLRYWRGNYGGRRFDKMRETLEAAQKVRRTRPLQPLP